MIKYFCEVHKYELHPCPYCRIEIEAQKTGLTLEDFKNSRLKHMNSGDGDIDTAAIAKAKEDMDNCTCNWQAMDHGSDIECPVHGEDKYEFGLKTDVEISISNHTLPKETQSIGRGLRTKSKEELLSISNIKAMEIQARMFGMISENNRRTQVGDSVAYSESDFQLLSEEFNQVIEDIQNDNT